MIDVKTKQELDNVLEENKVVLVKIGQEFCGPCRVVEKTMQEIESDYAGKAAFVIIDASDCDEELIEGIMSIPVIRLYVEGERKIQYIGLMAKEQIKNMLDEETKD